MRIEGFAFKNLSVVQLLKSRLMTIFFVFYVHQVVMIS